MQTELRGVSERVSALERSISQVAVDVTTVASRLAETGAVAGGHAEATFCYACPAAASAGEPDNA